MGLILYFFAGLGVLWVVLTIIFMLSDIAKGDSLG